MNPKGLTGIIFTLALAGFLASFVAGKPELLLVTEMYRHGHRAPIQKFLKDDNWTSFSELTEVGLRQHYVEGWELRRKYADFLPKNYSHLNIYTRSTNYNRTLQSAMAHSLGLFDLGTGPMLKDDYPVERAIPQIKDFDTKDLEKLGRYAIPNGFQPVPILTQDDADDLSTTGYMVCPLITNHRKNYNKTEKWKEISALFEKYMPDIGKHYDMPDLTVDGSQWVFDSLMSDYFMGNKTKIVKDSKEWHILQEIWDLAVFYQVYPTREAVKLAASPFISEFFGIMDMKINGTRPDMKWYAYSVHDINLVNMLLAFNLTSLDCLLKRAKNETVDPKEICLESSTFASLILFELYNNNTGTANETLIRMEYNSQFYSLCGGPEYCPYEPLKAKLLEEFYVKDWKLACGILPPPAPQPQSYGWFVPVLVVLSVIIVILMFALLRMRSKLYEMTLNNSIDDGQYVEVK